ncbi:MAG: hypothetical protein M1820_000930 [Bogoriella megaspora]|nr:MAG: hypothetical protein M1820_000930 [Bogoriella megaspora]
MSVLSAIPRDIPLDLAPSPGDVKPIKGGALAVEQGPCFPLFCTADLMPTTIQYLLRRVQSMTHSYNCFTLITSKDQTDFDIPTHIPIAPYVNDFLNASVDDCGAFTLSNIKGRYSINDLTYEAIAILDNRSAKEKTIQVAARDGGKWRGVRVKFEFGCYTAITMSESPSALFQRQDDGEEEDGIMNLEYGPWCAPRPADEIGRLSPP